MKKLVALLTAVLLLCSCAALADFNETGLPIVTDGEGFSILVDESGLVEDKIMLPILEEQTGVKVDFMCFPYQTALEKLGILLNGGDYPEVIGGWLLGKQDILDLSADGTFIPLDGLFEKYAPNITEILENEDVRKAFTLPDGHIYTIPYVIGEPECTFKPYINQEWLDRLGLEMPTTTEEFKEVLIAFRDNDANGNGDATDEIPFSGDPNNLNIGMLAGWFGVDVSGTATYPYFELVDGKLRFAANTEEYKAFLEFFNELYEENLIDPELFTQDLAMWKAKGKQGVYGVSIAYGSGDFFDWVDQYTPYKPLPVLSSPNCDKPLYHRNSYGVTYFLTQVALTDKCDEEKAAMIIRWFDNTFTKDNSAQIQWGPLGININKIEEDVYQTINNEDWDQAMKDKYSWGNFYCQSLPKYMRDMQLVASADATPEYKEMDIADELYSDYLNDTIAKVWVSDEADMNRSAILSTDINSYVKTIQAQFISGEADIAEGWDAYVEQLNTYGVDELTEIYARTLGIEMY